MEKIISGGLLYDTITVKVVDDPQERNAIVYYNLVWFRSDIYGSGSQEVSLPKPNWLDLSDHPIEVYVQFDSTSAWVFADRFSGTSTYDCGPTCFYRLWIFGLVEWEGKRSSIKVKLL